MRVSASQQAAERPRGVPGQLDLCAGSQQLGHVQCDLIGLMLVGDQFGEALVDPIRRVGRLDPRRMMDDLDDGPEGHAVPVGQAVAAQDRGPRPHLLGELLDQPGLADAGGTEGGDEMAPGLRQRPLEHELKELPLDAPADHGAVLPPDAARPARQHLQHPVDRQRPRRAPGP